MNAKQLVKKERDKERKKECQRKIVVWKRKEVKRKNSHLFVIKELRPRHFLWYNGKQARLANFPKWIWVLLGAPFVWPCATSKQKAYKNPTKLWPSNFLIKSWRMFFAFQFLTIQKLFDEFNLQCKGYAKLSPHFQSIR